MRLARRTFVAALAAAAMRPARAAADAPLVIQLGDMPIEAGAPAFYAQERGFFAAAGLDVKLTLLNNGAAIIAAMMSGAVDVGFASASPLIQARQRSLPIKFLQFSAIYTGAQLLSAILVAKDSPIRSAGDLAGKPIAVNGLHDLGQYQVQSWIDQNGGNSSTVQFVELPYAEMAAALQQGRIAAAGPTEPFVTAAKGTTRILGNLNEAIAHRYLMAGWISTEPWLARNPDAARRFYGAIQQAARWANAHPKDALPLLLQFTKITPETAAATGRYTFDESDRPDPKLIQPIADMMRRYGKLTPFTESDLVWTPR